MSALLELVLELVFNVVGCVLEIVAETWMDGFPNADTTASRVFLCVVLLLLAGLIWWELA